MAFVDGRHQEHGRYYPPDDGFYTGVSGSHELPRDVAEDPREAQSLGFGEITTTPVDSAPAIGGSAVAGALRSPEV